jgi:SEC-C motif domain protein
VIHPDLRCPCGSGLTYGECCGPVHAGAATAPTAEALMRSRFSAFAVGDEAYLLASWHPSTRPASIDLDGDTRWLRLDIIAKSEGGPFDERGEVVFEARYRSAGERGVLRERSRFLRESGRWYYVDGDVG